MSEAVGTSTPGRVPAWGAGTTFAAVLGCLVLAVAVTRFTGPVDGVVNTVADEGLIALSLTASLAAAARRRRALGAAGWLLAAAAGSALLGDLGWLLNEYVLHRTAYPDWPEALYLLAYVFLLAAGTVMVRRRSAGRDPGALIDSAIITTGLGVVVYCFIVAERLADSTAPLSARVVGGLYPTLDVLVLGLVARLLIGARAGRAPLVLLVLAMSGYLLGDLVFTTSLLLGASATWDPWVNTLYALFNLFTALALWHPDAGRSIEREGAGRERLGAGRGAALAVAGLLAPATLLAEHLLGRAPHVVAIALGGALLFGLTLLRMLLLVRAVESQRSLLEVQARTDALTGLANRRTFDHELDRALDTSATTGTPVSAALLDLDHFKVFNDTHGHAAGDDLLREAAGAWSAELARVAPGGCLARYGGEEFALLLPGLAATEATHAVRRLLEVTPRRQSFSAGVAGWDGTLSPRELLQRADERLYRAKAAGRARVHA